MRAARPFAAALAHRRRASFRLLSIRCSPHLGPASARNVHRRADKRQGRAMMQISFSLNGSNVDVAAEPAIRVSELLRGKFGLTGTKVGCNAGDCGACTILVDEQPVCACLYAAGQLSDRRVITIEGLPSASSNAAMLKASFLRHGAAQCGICTPGMLLAATAL